MYEGLSRAEAKRAAWSNDWLPPQVRKLAPRERQVAAFLYSNGPSTAKDVEGSLKPAISNGAVRSMLKRLVGKGILNERPSGFGKSFVYMPAITTELVRQKALRQLTEDYFGGSLLQAATTIATLAGHELQVAPRSAAFHKAEGGAEG